VSTAAPPTELCRLLARELGRHPGVRLGILFGSTARGTAAPGSDVDLALLAGDEDLLEVRRGLSLVLGREVDVVDLGAAPIPLLARILREGVVAYERDHGAAGAWRAHAIASLEIDLPWFERMRDALLRRVAERGL
jgi:predicted nucleotidyltransferase